MKRSANFRESVLECRRKAEKREAKKLQVAACEALLATHESLENRDPDYERHLRAKVRQKRNELQAMGL